MSHRSAILIDNFLPEDTFNNIALTVAQSPAYRDGKVHDYIRDDFWKKVTLLVLARMKEIGLHRDHFFAATEITNFSYNQFRPQNYGHGNFNGPHMDNGSYVYYIHPHWDENWEGKLKIIEAVDEQYRNGIHATPNRFIWMNPCVVHDITTTSPDSEHARVTNLGFQGGCFDENPVGVDYINIFTN